MEFYENRLFSFKLDGKKSDELPCTVKSERNGERWVRVYDFGDFRVTNTLRLYPAYGAYDWENVWENTSDKATGILSEIKDGDFALPLPEAIPFKWCAFIPEDDTVAHIVNPAGSEQLDTDFTVKEYEIPWHNDDRLFTGRTRTYTVRDARSSEDIAPFFRVHQKDRGVIVGIGWTGHWTADVTRTETGVAFRTGIADAAFYLKPGEKIRTSSVTALCYAGDKVDGQNAWRRFIRDVYSPIGKGQRPKEGALCMGIWGGMTSKSVIERVGYAAEKKMPFECVWMDAGWYGDSEKESPDEYEGDWFDYTGDWRVNPFIHPDGMEDVVKAIDKSGMDFMLWFEPERVVRTRPIVTEHPEFFLERPDYFHDLMLNLGDEKAWNYIYETLSGLIEKMHIRIFRQDFNCMPLAAFRKADGVNRAGITEIKHINGLYRLWDALLERFPDMIIDNCASGGRRLDVETLRRSVPMWRSDAQCPANFTPEISQIHMLTYGAWMPYSGTGTGRVIGDLYRLRSSYGTSMTTNYSFSEKQPFAPREEDVAWINKYLAEYKSVKHFFAGDMFPLTEQSNRMDVWSGVRFAEGDEGIVLLFRRPASPYETAAFDLRLPENANYLFTDEDTGEQITVKNNEPFRVTVKEKRTAKLYRYHKI